MPPTKGPSPQRVARTRRRFEYTTLSADRPLTAAQLTDYGADGWELVTIYVRMDSVYAVFKREVAG